jgi:Fe-S cluster assembly ATP-binding protein
MLHIDQLKLKLSQTTILNNLSLSVAPGEVHVIMGPNGSGKSSLALTLAGHPNYQPESGSASFLTEDLLEKTPEQRSQMGLFLSFQNPTSIAGVNNLYFIRQAMNSQRKARGDKEIDAYDFMQTIKTLLKDFGLKDSYLTRNMNEGFSGGEKKCNEIIQMMLMQPKLAILDEIDSGLDVDALKIVAKGINQFRDPARSVLMITHYQRLLDYVTPDCVHVLYNGTIIKSGDASLAKHIEAHGYQSLIEEVSS